MCLQHNAIYRLAPLHACTSWWLSALFRRRQDLRTRVRVCVCERIPRRHLFIHPHKSANKRFTDNVVAAAVKMKHHAHVCMCVCRLTPLLLPAERECHRCCTPTPPRTGTLIPNNDQRHSESISSHSASFSTVAFSAKGSGALPSIQPRDEMTGTPVPFRAF